jgi:hypothetical protein
MAPCDRWALNRVILVVVPRFIRVGRDHVATALFRDADESLFAGLIVDQREFNAAGKCSSSPAGLPLRDSSPREFSGM